MPEIEDLETDDTQDSGPNPLRKHVKHLEAELQAERQRAADGEQARRELAFMKAGIDLDSPTGRLFAKAYDGETSLDAVREAAIEYGLIKAPSPVAAPPEEQQAWDRVARSQSSGQTTGADIDFVERMRNAKSQAEVNAIYAEARAAQMG